MLNEEEVKDKYRACQKKYCKLTLIYGFLNFHQELKEKSDEYEKSLELIMDEAREILVDQNFQSPFLLSIVVESEIMKLEGQIQICKEILELS